MLLVPYSRWQQPRHSQTSTCSPRALTRAIAPWFVLNISCPPTSGVAGAPPKCAASPFPLYHRFSTSVNGTTRRTIGHPEHPFVDGFRHAYYMLRGNELYRLTPREVVDTACKSSSAGQNRVVGTRGYHAAKQLPDHCWSDGFFVGLALDNCRIATPFQNEVNPLVAGSRG